MHSLTARNSNSMEKFSYLDTVDFAATVCDKDGVVLYQNARAVERDGDVMGKNLYDCHGEKAGQMIRHMIETGAANTYQIVRHGKRKLLHQTPWFDESGAVAGLIELAIDLPDNMPVFDRDNTDAPTKPVCEHNPSINCPCPKECPRHSKCCLCVAHHREHSKLPVCMREKQ